LSLPETGHGQGKNRNGKMHPILIRLNGIGKSLDNGKKKCRLKLFDSLSLEIRKGETLGIMGKSGIGKTILGKIITGLEAPTRGQVLYHGANIDRMKSTEYKNFRSRVQMLFQDPEGTLNPRKTIGEMLNQVRFLTKCPWERHRQIIKKTCSEVGLHTDLLEYLPWQLSGGINQRAALARILMLEPEVIVLDEPTSALDLSIQAQILQLLKRIQEKSVISYVLISHDREVIDWMSHRIGILENHSFHIIR
jgi:peptide/nickel transport system ATP-binding protein